MAKTRAQRKAERRAREAEQQKRQGSEREEESRAQHDTQVPRSGDIAEIEAVEEGIEAGAPEADLETPDAPAPAREDKKEKRRREKSEQKRKKDQQKQQERQQLEKRKKQASAERQRGGVIGFLASCWAELKKVQWPDRDTLIQATAVTIVFVVVAAAYLGALDAVFNFIVKRIL